MIAYMTSRYEIGEPAVNLLLAILLQAKKDDDNELWQDFQKTELFKNNNKDSFEIAEWVVHYLEG